jgi:SAM-dependent methyltransferase
VKNKAQYFMDDPREACRLAEKVDPTAWVERYLGPYLPAKVDVLDVGCGPGVIAAEVARRLPFGHVVGLDISSDRVAEVRRLGETRPNLRGEVGDAAELPFAPATFDLVYSGLLLEYLPDKPRAVTEKVRVCRPGGQAVLFDLDGQLLWHNPPDPELEVGIQKVIGALHKTGFDPFVGRKLYALAHAAGLTNLKVRVDPYHLYAGQMDEETYRLWALKLDIVKPIAAEVLGGLAAAEQLIRRFLDYYLRDDTFTYSVSVTVTGTRQD